MQQYSHSEPAICVPLLLSLLQTESVIDKYALSQTSREVQDCMYTLVHISETQIQGAHS